LGLKSEAVTGPDETQGCESCKYSLLYAQEMVLFCPRFVDVTPKTRKFGMYVFMGGGVGVRK